MYQHKRTNPVYKLTLVSIMVNGRSLAVFLKLPVVDGKVTLTYSCYNKLADSLGARRGDTISFG